MLWTSTLEFTIRKTPGLLDRVISYVESEEALNRMGARDLEDLADQAYAELNEERDQYEAWVESGAKPVYTGTDW